MTYTEEQLNAEAAEGIVQIARHVDTGVATEIVVLGEAGDVAQWLDKHMARAVAVRLVELAAQLPDPPKILRRPASVDDELRNREE